MRYIEVPKPVEILGVKQGDAHPVWTFPFFVLRVLAEAHMWFADSASEDAFGELLDRLPEDAEPGDLVELTDAVHEQLEKCVRAFPFAGAIKADVFRFVRAITKAPKSVPQPPKAAAPAAPVTPTPG